MSFKVSDYAAPGLLPNGSDWTSAVNATIAAAMPVGDVVFDAPGGKYGLSSPIVFPRGISPRGQGSGPEYVETDNVVGTTLIALPGFPAASAPLIFGNRWNGTFDGILLDGAFIAQQGIVEIGPQKGGHSDIGVVRIGDGTSKLPAWYVTTDGATYASGAQYPSAGMNKYSRVSITALAAGTNAMVLSGSLSGATETGAITANVFDDFMFLAGNGAISLTLNQCCDNNYFNNGSASVPIGAGSIGVLLNFSAINNDVGQNYFTGLALGCADPNGISVVAKNNFAANVFTGCYLNTEAQAYRDDGGGKVIFSLCSYNDQYYLPITAVAPTVSPFTYANTHPYPVEVTLWGGSVSALSRTRNGVSSGVGTGNVQYSFLLAPSDSLKVTFTGAPVLQIIPHT